MAPKVYAVKKKVIKYGSLLRARGRYYEFSALYTRKSYARVEAQRWKERDEAHARECASRTPYLATYTVIRFRQEVQCHEPLKARVDVDPVGGVAAPSLLPIADAAVDESD